MKHFFRFANSWLLAWLLLGAAPLVYAQAPAWQMAVAIGDGSQVNATVADANGNVYVAGRFMGTADFSGIVLTSAYGSAFVAKWSTSTGRFVWARQTGGTGSVSADDLALSGSSLYLTGSFSGTATFGSTSLTEVPGMVSYGGDIFVAKLTDAGPTGSFVWVQAAGGPGADVANAVAVVGVSVYVAGNFAGTSATFGSTTLTNSNPGGPTPGGGTSSISDVFVAKLVDAGSTGAFVGALWAGGSGNDVAFSMVANGPNVYLTGSSSSVNPSFGGLLANGGGLSDIFVAKLTDATPMGRFTWVQGAGGPDFDYATAVAVAGTSVYITGSFRGTGASFGGTRLTNVNATATGSEAFVAKLTDNGSSGLFVWAQKVGLGTGFENGLVLAASGADVYVGGTFDGPVVFGNVALTSAGYEDLFLAKIADSGATGTLMWVQQAGGTRSDFVYALAATPSTVYAGGSFQFPAASFGSFVLPLASATSTVGGFFAALPAATGATATGAVAAATFAVFPNPAQGTATVQLPAGLGPATLTLLDAQGRVIRTQAAAPARTELDLSGLAPGLYALRVTAGRHTVTRRLVVEE